MPSDNLLDATMYSKQQRAPKAQVIVQDPPHSMSSKKKHINYNVNNNDNNNF